MSIEGTGSAPTPTAGGSAFLAIQSQQPERDSVAQIELPLTRALHRGQHGALSFGAELPVWQQARAEQSIPQTPDVTPPQRRSAATSTRIKMLRAIT